MRAARWTRWALVVSLGLNLIVVGLFVGARVGGGWDDRTRGGPEGRGGIPLTRTLERDERRALGRAVRNAVSDAGFDRARARALREGVQAALLAEPFDRDALMDALAAQTEFGAARTRVAHGVFADYAAGLSPQARAAMAESLDRGPGRPRDN